MPRKHWHIQSLPNKPLALENAVIYTGQPTEVSVTLTYTQEAHVIYGPLGGGAVKCLLTEIMRKTSIQ